MATSRKVIVIFIIAAIMAICALVLNMGMVSATDIFVGPGENYTTIQSAVAIANPFDTIIVRDGTYNENIDVTVDNVTIRSENGSAHCFVNASSQNDHVFEVTADNVTITGFKIIGATGGGIAGIQLSYVDNCEVVSNICSDNYHGIIVFTGSNNIICDNDCFVNLGIGIYLHWCRSNTVSYNDCSNNEHGICLIGSGSNTISDNDCSDNGGGIRLYVDCSNNSLSGNTCNSNHDHGIHLWNSSNNLIYNNYFDNTFNAYDNRYNIWNITKTAGINIIGGPYLGGNYWSNYAGNDINGDGLGDMMLPYNSSSGIKNGGDWLPLIKKTRQDVLKLGESTSYVLNLDTGSKQTYAEFLNSKQREGDRLKFTIYVSKTGNPILDDYVLELRTNMDNPEWKFGDEIYHAATVLVWKGHDAHEALVPQIVLSGEVPKPGEVYAELTVGTTEDGATLATIIQQLEPSMVFFSVTFVFDTHEGSYPSISGMFNGTVAPSCNLSVSKLYTYPCPGTGGHAEYVRIWNGPLTIAEETWKGYQGDWHILTFDNSFTLYANETYNYSIKMGSYPQIIHEPSWNATGGVMTCEEFVDINGKQHDGWIPAIRLE